MFVSKTPLRVSFFGGGTDYPEYFANHPGGVLGGTINKYIYTTAVPLAPFAEQRFRVSYRVVEDCNTVDEISHPVIREWLRHSGYDTPTGFYTVSDLPGSTGLGSSSSFTVGFINLVENLPQPARIGHPLPCTDIAVNAIRLERDVLGENCGVQDQIHAAMGGLAAYNFTTGDNNLRVHRDPINLSGSRSDLLNVSMILVYTDIQRHASQIAESQIKQTTSGSNADYLSAMYDMVGEAKHIFERPGSDSSALADIGAMLNQSWSLKQNLGKGVTNPVVDDIYNKGIDMGAWGGKLLGAGGGGFVMFLLNHNLIPKFRTEFGADNVIPVKFTDTGSVVKQI